VYFKQQYALSSLLFNSALEYAMRRLQENKGMLGVHRTCRLLVCADDVSFSSRSIIVIKNIEAVLDASKEVGLEQNTQQVKYMFLSHLQTMGISHYINVAVTFQNTHSQKHPQSVFFT
jgi:hypothetical protein